MTDGWIMEYAPEGDEPDGPMHLDWCGDSECGDPSHRASMAEQALKASARIAKLEAEVERLRGEVMQAVAELDAEHSPDDPRNVGPQGGCVLCWPKVGSWPCVTRMIADDLRAIVRPKENQ